MNPKIARVDDHQRATCAKKVRHRTRAKAIRSASLCASNQPGLHLHAYRCAVCNGWHLTHQERRLG